jgi:Zn-dependent membrane protease YugP
MTGEAMAVRILQQGHIDSVSVEPSSGPLANFYDWRRRQLRLSKEVCGGPTVALVAIAAHEAGYVLQPLWLSLIRTLTTFAVRLGAIGAWLIFAAGLLLDSGFIALFGSAIYSAVVLLSLLVSLIGIDVNRRVRQVLLGLDLGGVETSATFREVLNAAAYSQVAEMLPVVGGLWKSKS